MGLCLTQVDWDVVIGECQDPCGDVLASLSITSSAVLRVATWETGHVLIYTVENFQLYIHSSVQLSMCSHSFFEKYVFFFNVFFVWMRLSCFVVLVDRKKIFKEITLHAAEL